MLQRFLNHKRRILRSGEAIEPEEIFPDAVNSPGFRHEMQEGRMERPIAHSSFIAFGAAMALAFGVIIWRLADLQILRGALFLTQAQTNRTYPILIQAPRGIIYDHDFEKLVENTPTFVVTMKPGLVASDQEFVKALEQLAALVGREISEIAEDNSVDYNALDVEESLARRASWPAEIFVASGELREAVLEIQSRPEDFPAVNIAEAGRRRYFLGEYSSHVLGFVGRPSREDLRAQNKIRPSEMVGKAGIELEYERFLRGQAGEKLIEVNALGEPQRERYIVKATPGRNIVLEVDAGLQRFAASALERHTRALGKKAGAVVVIDPRDGAIRALVSFPGFDSNLFSRGASRKEIQRLLNDSSNPFFNRAISAGYPSGSTIKPIMAVAALEEKIIGPERAIYDPGYLSVPNPFDPSKPTIYKDWKELGWVDMRRAIALSANVYFYTIGGGYRDIKGLGIKRIKRFLEIFGWGETLGIDLPGEIKGLIPDPETKKIIRPNDPIWRIGDTYITSIGQGDIQTTPLQLAASIAAIANDGTLWRPRLAKAVVDEERNVVEEFKPRIIRGGLAARESFKVVREGMRQAVTDGSAKALADLFFTVAGKTGTAQTGVYGKNHGWFVGFAPYENPEIVVAVLVEEGTGGTTDAVPIAKEILYHYFTSRR